MKFGFISTMEGCAWGGSEELWCRAADHLLDDGHTAVACVRDWGVAEAVPIGRLSARGMRLYRRRTPTQLTTAALVRAKIAHRLGVSRPETPIYEGFAAERPDLTVVSLGGGLPCQDSCGPLMRADLKFVVLIHGAAEQWWPDDDSRRQAVAIMSAAQAVLFVSEGNRRLVSRQLVFEHPRSLIVRNPFLVPYDIKLPWPAEASPLRLASVGRIDPETKGCDIALEALALPSWRERDVSLTFFGTGPAEQGVRALATRLGIGHRVDFAGHVSDISAIWRSHHALLLPSRHEGMPLVVIEAMLCGRPCIVTDIAGNGELVAEGLTGFMAPAATIPAVAEALERAYAARDRWPILGAEAARVVRQLVPRSPSREFAKLLVNFAQEK